MRPQAKFLNTQKEKINIFINLAIDFNKTHNIFARKFPQEVLEKDVYDCAPIIKMIPPTKTVIDLGSGGGFPGILLSITKPNNKIYLLEGSRKKCYFLKKVVEKLKLKNTTILNTSITENNNIGTFDIITARAFAPIEKIIKLTHNNTTKKTKYILLKGKEQKIREELKLLNKKKFKYEIIKQNNTKLERNIVVITNE
tara:strand:+ start:4324 stop:4917 length:594 start_codon:yes stop_codon:yes gene_type:complete